uniref:Uncharacterized protein n=1 Tax=Arundo donax TaxID=35708 RepID=A0A0A8Z339_ARUDO
MVLEAGVPMADVVYVPAMEKIT